jgi:serine/threonine protein kinase
VRLTGFSRSHDEDSVLQARGKYVSPHYSAPEAWDEVEQTTKVDSFSFGLIRFELLTGTAGFHRDLTPLQVLGRVHNWRPEIPAAIVGPVQDLISECWSNDPSERPTFFEIFRGLQGMEYKLIDGVKCAKVRAYVEEIVKYEEESPFCSMEYTRAARDAARQTALSPDAPSRRPK